MLRLPEVVPSISQVWASERREFTPWLTEHLELLDVLGLGRLRFVEREKAVSGALKALDVLAATPNGQLVAIENQFATLDHDHLTRGLAYAVGLQASTLVLIAEDVTHPTNFSAEVRRVLFTFLGLAIGIAVLGIGGLISKHSAPRPAAAA